MSSLIATKRPARERGHTQLPWLDSWHSFAFGEYRDPQHHSFRTLRVINEDRVAPGQGFPAHPHRNMEILTYVVAGELSHRDSMGHTRSVGPGQVQYMSAGAGLTHSEFNASSTEDVHFLQIWIIPHALGLRPAYEEWAGDPAAVGGLALVASPEKHDGVLTVRQDVSLFLGKLAAGGRTAHIVLPERAIWLQVVAGNISANGESLEAGDGLALECIPACEIEAATNAEFLLFDLA